MPFQETGLSNICLILFQEHVSSSLDHRTVLSTFQMSEGAQESLLSQTDAEVLGKPLANLSKVIIVLILKF